MKVELLKISGKMFVCWMVLSSIIFSIIIFFAYQTSLSIKSKVPNAKKYSEIMAKKCSKRLNWQDCYGQEFGYLARNQSIEDVFTVLDGVQVIDEKMNDCHFVGHAIAATLSQLDKSGDFRNWQKYLKSLGLRCQAGFIHGIIEAMSLNKPDFSLRPTLIDEVCTEMGKSVPADSFYVEQLCIHGMGHIVLVGKKGDLNKAVEICSQTNSKSQFMCQSGVFMENIERKNLEAHGIAKKIKYTSETIQNQESICRRYTGIVAGACWMEIGHMYAGFAENDLHKIQTQCKIAPEPEFQEECYFQGATIVALEANLQDELYSKLCEPMYGSLKTTETCIDRIILVLIYNSVRYEGRARKFCDSLPTGYKQYCNDLVDKRLKAAVSFEFN